MEFTLTLYPDKIHYVDAILDSTVQLLEKYFERSGSGKDKLSGDAARKVVDLLAHPQRTLKLQVLDMEHPTRLLDKLEYSVRKQVCMQMIKGILADPDQKLETVDTITNLFTFLDPMIKDADDGNAEADSTADAQAFVADQQEVCKLV